MRGNVAGLKLHPREIDRPAVDSRRSTRLKAPERKPKLNQRCAKRICSQESAGAAFSRVIADQNAAFEIHTAGDYNSTALVMRAVRADYSRYPAAVCQYADALALCEHETFCRFERIFHPDVIGVFIDLCAR